MPDIQPIPSAGGDHCQAAADLLPLVYDELKRLAADYLSRESPGHTLQATAVVHEAYLRLASRGDTLRWSDSSHFFAAISQAMRWILIDSARSKKMTKRGPGMKRHGPEDLPDYRVGTENDHAIYLIALDQALSCLAEINPRAAMVVEMRHFSGLSHSQIAKILGVVVRTIDNDWAYARAWLSDFIQPDAADQPAPAS